MFDFLSPADPSAVIECTTSASCTVVHSILSAAIIFFVLLTGFAYTTVLERRFIAWIQARIGPNRAGPKGLLQPLADGIKLIFKEDVTPLDADKVVYRLAPILKVVPTLVVLAVVPLGPPITIPWFDGEWYRISQGLIDVNVGVLWILAITSVSVYGVVMAGWSSNNKYAMLGSLRSSASMISYELALSASFVPAILLAGSMSVGDIVDAQSGNFIFNWFIFDNPVAALIMAIALFAETNRAPFDLPEAEQELVAGHMTEYSGMSFAVFFMAEYISMIAVGVVFASMYLGGYHFILTEQAPILGPIWLTLKVIAWLSFMVWVRATLPRIRYDRLMTLGWKVMLPVALLAIAWTASIIVISEETENPQSFYTIATLVLLAIVGLGLYVFGRESAAEQAAEGQQEVVELDKRGIGYLILQLVGGLLSVPAQLFGYTVNTMQNMGSFVGTGARRNPPREEEDEAALLLEESSAPQLGSGGGH